MSNVAGVTAPARPAAAEVSTNDQPLRIVPPGGEVVTTQKGTEYISLPPNSGMSTPEMISALAAALVSLIAFIYFMRVIQAWMLHRTLREAIQRDSAAAGQLIDRIERQDRSGPEARGDDRNGLVLIALGVALAGYALIVNDPEWSRYGLGAALFPVLVGLVLVARHVWLRRANRDA